MHSRLSSRRSPSRGNLSRRGPERRNRHSRRIWLRAATLHAIAFLAVFAAGCSESSSSRGTEAGSKGTIGVSLLTLQNPFFKTLGDHITKVAEANGYSTIVASADDNVDKQSQQIQDFIERGCAAIILSPAQSTAIGTAIQAANEKGIPVFTTDIGCLAEGVDIVCHVATANLEGGREAGRALIEALGEAGGNVLVIDHKSVESCILRVRGFKEIIEAHNREAANPITIVAELPGEGAEAAGYKAAEDALQSHADLVGIFAINDPSAMGAVAAVEKAGKADQITIIGFDGAPLGKKAILEGKIYADPIQFPDRIGEETMGAVLKYFAGEEVPREILIPTQLYRRADAEKEFGAAGE